ncbi:peptidase S9 [Alishewanella longhuensis]
MQGISTDLYAANIDGSRRTLIFAKRNDGILYSIMHMLPQQKDRILIARYNLRDKTGWRVLRWILIAVESAI